MTTRGGWSPARRSWWGSINTSWIEEPPIDTLIIDEAVENEQKKKLEAMKQRRDNKRVAEALGALKKAAEGTDNLMPHILEAVRAYATLQEMVDTLREVFGEYRDPGYV